MVIRYYILSLVHNQYISHNDGMFNNAVNQQRDTLINANQMIDLGRAHYTPEELQILENIKAAINI